MRDIVIESISIDVRNIVFIDQESKFITIFTEDYTIRSYVVRMRYFQNDGYFLQRFHKFDFIFIENEKTMMRITQSLNCYNFFAFCLSLIYIFNNFFSNILNDDKFTKIINCLSKVMMILLLSKETCLGSICLNVIS